MNKIVLSEDELTNLLNSFYSYFETGYDLTAKRYGVEDFDNADEINYRIQAKRNFPNSILNF